MVTAMPSMNPLKEFDVALLKIRRDLHDATTLAPLCDTDEYGPDDKCECARCLACEASQALLKAREAVLRDAQRAEWPNGRNLSPAEYVGVLYLIYPEVVTPQQAMSNVYGITNPEDVPADSDTFRHAASRARADTERNKETRDHYLQPWYDGGVPYVVPQSQGRLAMGLRVGCDGGDYHSFLLDEKQREAIAVFLGLESTTGGPHGLQFIYRK